MTRSLALVISLGELTSQEKKTTGGAYLPKTSFVELNSAVSKVVGTGAASGRCPGLLPASSLTIVDWEGWNVSALETRG